MLFRKAGFVPSRSCAQGHRWNSARRKNLRPVPEKPPQVVNFRTVEKCYQSARNVIKASDDARIRFGRSMATVSRLRQRPPGLPSLANLVLRRKSFTICALRPRGSQVCQAATYAAVGGLESASV